MVWSQFHKATVCPSLSLKTKQWPLGLTPQRLAPQLYTAEGMFAFPPHPQTTGVPRKATHSKAAFYSAAPVSLPLTSQATHRDRTGSTCVGEQRRGLKSTAAKEGEDSRSEENKPGPRGMRGPAFAVLTGAHIQARQAAPLCPLCRFLVTASK